MGFKPTTLCLICTHSKNTSSCKDVFFFELLKVNLVCCNSYNIKLPWHNATDFSFIESFYLFIVTLAILSILTFQLTSPHVYLIVWKLSLIHCVIHLWFCDFPVIRGRECFTLFVVSCYFVTLVRLCCNVSLLWC